MKRKIEDYINQKVAVECSSKKEWQKILDLVGKSTATNYFDKSCNKCIDLDDITSYWSVSSKQGIISNGYTIYPASDFLEEEHKFEVGKWYKNIGKYNKAYAKCKRFENNEFYISDHIGHDKKYQLYTNDGYFSQTNYQKAELLIDLSEIQEYLPLNHSDLIVKNICPEYVEYIDTKYKGQIVRVTEWSSANYCKIHHPIDGILKPFKDLVKPSTKEAFDLQNQSKKLTVDSLIENEIYYHIDAKNIVKWKNPQPKYYLGNGNTDYNNQSRGNFDDNPTSFRLATNKEKKWLNTCISQDKFISKEDLHLYDDSGLLIKKKLIKQIEEGLDLTDRWIKCIKKCDWEDINIGEYVQIKSKGIIANVEWKNKDGYYLNLKRVEETKEFELMPEGFSPYEFKIGDYLYVIDYRIEQISPKDSVLQITNIEEKYYGKWITYINIRTRWTGGFRQNHFIDNIRKATEKEILDYLSDNYHKQTSLTPEESFFTETDKMIINGFLNGNGQIFRNNIDSEDIYIMPITKKQTKIQTITIESITNLNLNLKTIKPKQIQIIKI